MKANSNRLLNSTTCFLALISAGVFLCDNFPVAPAPDLTDQQAIERVLEDLELNFLRPELHQTNQSRWFSAQVVELIPATFELSIRVQPISQATLIHPPLFRTGDDSVGAFFSEDGKLTDPLRVMRVRP